MVFTKRNPGADLIRIFALFCVVSVHFFLNCGFYGRIVAGKRMYVMTLMRSFFMICVPLFIMLSGYLLRKKQLEKSYYGRIGKILVTYLLASLLCAAYSVLVLDEDFSVADIILGILGFTAAPYAWYIEMYLGLFLLIPFLNITYQALPSRKAKIWLILTLLILTAVPTFLNAYNFMSLSWWALPSSSPDIYKIFPAWWQRIFPLVYYYIGCYIGEYGLKMNRTRNILLIVLWTVLAGSYSYWRSYQATFVWGEWCNYPSPFVIIPSVLVFILLINLNYDKLPHRLSRLMQKISGLCLGAYLVSWIFDSELYAILSEKVPAVPDRFVYYVILVPAVFVLSLLTSYFLSIAQRMIEKTFSLLYRSLRRGV